MITEGKGINPFHPNHPVPVELFVGRKDEIERINRAAHQVSLGKPQSVFIMGEYGIGKTSLARIIKFLSEKQYGLLGFHILLGSGHTLEDMAVATVKEIVESDYKIEKLSKRIQKLFTNYIDKITFFGITLHLDKVKQEAQNITYSYLPFLKNIYKQVQDDYKGLVLILDEINGITKDSKFAHFLKKLNDENALSREPLPLLLILCGTAERYREIVSNHQPVERIFNIAQINRLNHDEMSDFFNKAFTEANMIVDKKAMKTLCYFSNGFPKLMHLIGESAYLITEDDLITEDVARESVIAAAEEVGRKFIDQQVMKALQSKDYRNILNKISQSTTDWHYFTKSEIEKKLNKDEKKKLSNFLRRMKKLNVIVPGDIRGEYKYCDQLTRIYLFLQSIYGD